MARILVAEDENAVREFVRRALVHHGHEVTVANDGAEALAMLAQSPVDLVLADIRMPVMDGVALALKAARDYPDVTIMLMTGHASERDRAHDLRTLVEDIVLKPFSMAEICNKVDAALARRSSR